MKQQTTLNQQKINYYYVLAFLLIVSISNAQIFYTEDFETDGNGTRYFPEVEVRDASNDYFLRTDGSTISANGGNNYVNQSGTYYWAGEDHDDPGVGGSGNPELELEIRDVNIIGKTNLFFTALFGGHVDVGLPNGPGPYENLDYVIVEYRIDNGAWLPGISFLETGNKVLAQDTDGNGVGDGGVLNINMQVYDFPIVGTGNEIDIRIRAASNSSSEEWAIDLIQLSENSTLSNVENELIENDITIYSINNSGFFQINTSNNIKVKTIEVFDVTGKNVNSITMDNDSNNYNIDLSHLKASIYILKIYTDKGVFNKKMIKK